jgi:nitroreductase
MTEILHLKEDVRPVAILPIGYAAEEPAARGRESLEKVTT